MSQTQSKDPNAPLLCTYEDCEALQCEDCEFCEEHAPKEYTIQAYVKSTQKWSLNDTGDLKWQEHEYDVDNDDITSYIIVINGDEEISEYSTFEEAQTALLKLKN